jgi:dTMP kinase
VSGVFVTFEGTDGVGKSTQARRLAERLRREGLTVVETFEPGGTRLGAEIRRLLLTRKEVPLYPEAEMLLYAADRAQHVREVIRPALRQGCVVVCDRYLDSSVAYQSASGLDAEEVLRVNRLAVDGLLPDLTFWLDRPSARPPASTDRMEGRGPAFQAEVRRRFEELWRRNPERIVRISMEGTPEAVAEVVYQAFRERFGRLGKGREDG